MNYKNGSLGLSIYDYTTNYTLYMGNISIEENADQIKAVLNMFMKNDTVFEDPANILVISFYAFLVTAASKSCNDFNLLKRNFLSFGKLVGHVRCAEEEEHEDSQEHLHVQPGLVRLPAGHLHPLHCL
jgi:hypothetical protein